VYTLNYVMQHAAMHIPCSSSAVQCSASGRELTRAFCVIMPGEQVMASRTSLGAAALGVLALCCAQLAHGNLASFTTNFGVPR